MSKITIIGLDIAKNSFAAHGFDACGKTVLKTELKRGQREALRQFSETTIEIYVGAYDQEGLVVWHRQN